VIKERKRKRVRKRVRKNKGSMPVNSSTYLVGADIGKANIAEGARHDKKRNRQLSN
jgi:hypothetical protein